VTDSYIGNETSSSPGNPLADLAQMSLFFEDSTQPPDVLQNRISVPEIAP